jgi:membrane-bound lytic murein transglycosylase F
MIFRIFGLSLILFLFSCSNTAENNTTDSKVKSNNSQVLKYDLEDIIKRDTLKAITIYSPTSYFIYKGEVLGFEYELLKRLSEKLGVHLQIVIAKNLDDMFNMLNLGKGDIIAYGITVTKNRKKKANFTNAYMKIHQVLIQKDDKNKLTDITELGQKTISVRKNSSYIERLKNISNEIGEEIYIDTIPGDRTTDEIIRMIHNGKINYTISDDNIAKVNSTYYHDLDMSVPVSLSQNLAWVVRKSSTNLLNKMNKMIEEYVGSLPYNILYNKYFKNKRK